MKWHVTLEIENESLVDESCTDEREWFLWHLKNHSSLHIGGHIGEIIEAKTVSVSEMQSQPAKGE